MRLGEACAGLSRYFRYAVTLRQLRPGNGSDLSFCLGFKARYVFQGIVRVSVRSDVALLAIPSKTSLLIYVRATDAIVVQLDHAAGPTDGIGSMRNDDCRNVVQVLIETIK